MTARFLPYGRQSVDQADIDAVIRVLKSDYLTTGPEIGKFEAALCAATGAAEAVCPARTGSLLAAGTIGRVLRSGSAVNGI